MANPTIQEMKIDTIKTGNLGACREWWAKIPELSAAADADAGGNLYLYYAKNPYNEDVVITEALANITTEDAQDGDIDIGLADDAEGTNSGTELCDSLVNSGKGVKRLLAALDGIGVAAPIWRKSGGDSYITVKQNGDADVSALRWNLLIKCIPLADLS
jgi:hypothetical protein